MKKIISVLSKKIISVLSSIVKPIFSGVSVLIMILMLNAISYFSKYVVVSLVVAAFVFEIVAVICHFIKGMIPTYISAGSSLIAGILGFVSFSNYPGWSDLKLFSIWCLIFIISPALKYCKEYISMTSENGASKK